MVHRVPITKISITEQASLAIAKDADKTFKEQVCAPEQNMFAMKVNKIIKEMTEALELAFNEMTLTDADTQSKIDERRIKTGVDLPNEVRARDGKPHIKGGDERVDLNAKDKIAQAQAEERTQRERDSARSAGATDSAGAARTPKGEGRTTA
jgi:capsid portal protein